MADTPKRPHPNLSKELIVAKAIDLVEREGETALSMRRLGAALGVQAMSLYHHLEGRDGLTEAIAERIYAPMQSLDLGADWREASERFGHALRRVAVEHPRTFRLVGVQAHEAPRAGAERLVALLGAAGFERREALGIYRAVASYSRGYALGETLGFVVGNGELDTDATFERGLTALLDGFTPRAS